MATWQKIGQDNFRAAVALLDNGFYRDATSRFYYATFSVLTHELLRRNALSDFRDRRATPGHRQMPQLIQDYFTHMSDERLVNLTNLVRTLYSDRLGADYSQLRLDKQSCLDSYRTAKKIFNYLEVP